MTLSVTACGGATSPRGRGKAAVREARRAVREARLEEGQEGLKGQKRLEERQEGR